MSDGECGLGGTFIACRDRKVMADILLYFLLFFLREGRRVERCLCFQWCIAVHTYCNINRATAVLYICTVELQTPKPSPFI